MCVVCGVCVVCVCCVLCVQSDDFLEYFAGGTCDGAVATSVGIAVRNTLPSPSPYSCTGGQLCVHPARVCVRSFGQRVWYQSLWYQSSRVLAVVAGLSRAS